jgi:hypothetical protein
MNAYTSQGFMPSFKFRQKKFLFELERGRKALGYESRDTCRLRIALKKAA